MMMKQLVVLLNNLDKKPYDTLVSTLKYVDTILSEIELALLDHELKEKNKNPSTSTRESMFYSKKEYKSKEYFHCGRKGHIMANCRLKHLSK